MASLHTIVALTIVFAATLPRPSTTNTLLPPALSPILDAVCKEGLCGKGSCKESNNAGLGYECECDAGWKQTRSQNDTLFKFLPCVIPNCSINYSCGKAPAPAPAPAKTLNNTSIIEPCNWAECGGGTCNKTSPLTYTCECRDGYFNLLNSTALPCVKECALGMDCKDFGIGLPKSSTNPSSPSLSDNNNKASSIVGGGFFWKVIAAASIAIFFLN